MLTDLLRGMKMKNSEINATEDFCLYLERYCIKHKVTPEVAVEHAVVKEVEKFYEERSLS